jgi:phosphomannomutase
MAGRSILGDQLLALLAQDVLVDCPGATILGDVKASQAVLTGFPRWAAFRDGTCGAQSHQIRNEGERAVLAGETTGHIFYKHRFYGFDDALYAAVRLLGALARRGDRWPIGSILCRDVLTRPNGAFPSPQSASAP